MAHGVMISGDRTVLEEGSAVRERVVRYADALGSLTVIVTGRGESKRYSDGPLTILYPGGSSFVSNFIRMTRVARAESRGADVVTAQDPYFIGLVGLIAAWGRAPLQIQIHGALFARAFMLESLRHAVESVLALVVLRAASCVRSVSEQSARAARRVTLAPVSVLPVNVAVDSFTHTYPCPKEYGDHPRILAVSRLSHEKNIVRIIRAFATLTTDAHLYIAGEGPMRRSLELSVKSLELEDRVHFLGWVTPQAYMAHATCVVHASLYEGYCMTLVEAVLSGVPVVTTDVGVARQLPSELTRVVAQSDAALAEGLRDVLAHPVEPSVRERARAGLKGQLLSPEETSRRFVELLLTCGSA
jgi:glycosyltransferase involved in cell wall biosynthesis